MRGYTGGHFGGRGTRKDEEIAVWSIVTTAKRQAI